MKIIVISALAIVVLLSALAPNVMAAQGYWTASNSYPTAGLKKYHIFLNGTYPSSADRSIKLKNEGLSIYVRLSENFEPAVCHAIKEGDIPPTNNNILDAGYFIIPKESDPGVYTKVKYKGIKIGEALEGPVRHARFGA